MGCGMDLQNMTGTWITKNYISSYPHISNRPSNLDKYLHERASLTTK